MNTILYIAIFSIGITFGSFFTLAVYRIPRKEDITHVRSHCTTCNHRLNFWDLIPIFSYLFLRGKCRYCGEKIRIRYFLLEILSGIVFILLALTRNVTYEMNITLLASLALTYLFIAGTFIIAGIDKENKEIPNGLIIYELIVGIAYLIFKVAIGESIISNVAGMVALPLLLLLINVILEKVIKIENELPFGMGDIKYIAVLGLFVGFGVLVLTMLLGVLFATLHYLTSREQRQETHIALGFYISIAVNIMLIVMPYIPNTLESIEMMLKW